MVDFVLAPPTPPSLAIAGSAQRFPIRRVFCVGRNYADHAREMGSDPDREPPFFFAKPADAVVPAEGVLPYPPQTAQLHHEVELVVALGAGGADLDAAAAQACVWGLDLTRRDLQEQAKRSGRPWDMAKGFDASAPCTPLRPRAGGPLPAAGAIWLDVNGQRRQTGDLAQMIWSVPEVIAHLSRLVRLAPGDLIFTGTPAGVGPLQPGDQVEAGIAGLATLRLQIGPPA